MPKTNWVYKIEQTGPEQFEAIVTSLDVPLSTYYLQTVRSLTDTDM